MESTLVLADEVKGDVSWLDEEFVKKVLRRMNDYTELSIGRTSISMVTSPGENFFSLMYRVRVEFSKGGGVATEQLSFIVKSLPESDLVRKMVMDCSIFTREVSVYASLLPALHTMLDELAPGQFPRFAAQGLFWESSPAHHLAMEDLSSSGFTTARRRQGLDPAHCRLALETLGRFHGASAVLHARHPAVVEPFLANSYSAAVSSELRGLLVNTVSALATEVEGWVGYEEYGRKLRLLLPKFFGKVVGVMSLVESSPSSFRTLNHLDLWVNNIMFAYSEGRPIAARFIDFQMPSVMSPAIDLVYFLYTSPTPELRANGKEEMLTWYHNSLKDTLCRLGHPTPCLTFQDLLDEVAHREFYGLFAACTVLPFVLSSPGTTISMQEVIGDSPSIDTRTFYSPEYVAEIKKMLPVFDARGFLD